jgi:hypothetical protein
VAVVKVSELVDKKVAATLAEMNGTLEQLVAEAVEREISRTTPAEYASPLARSRTTLSSRFAASSPRPPAAKDWGWRSKRKSSGQLVHSTLGPDDLDAVLRRERLRRSGRCAD